MTVQKMIAGLVPKMRSMPQPIIAAVNGAASGGGLALALASDVRIAAPTRASTSRSCASACRVATSACRGCCPRLVGASRAFELLLTGRLIDAAEADRIGLVTPRRRRRAGGRVGARDRRAHRRQQPVRRAHDEGGHVEPARDRQPAGRHRPREPHAGAVELHRRPHRGHAGVRREAAGRTSPTSSAPTSRSRAWQHKVRSWPAASRWSPAAGAGSARRSRSASRPTAPTSPINYRKDDDRRGRDRRRDRTARPARGRVRGVGRRPRRVRGHGRAGARRLRRGRHPREQRGHRVARPDRRRHRSGRDGARLAHARVRVVDVLEARAAVDAHPAARRHRDDLERGHRAHGRPTRRRTTWRRPRSKRWRGRSPRKSGATAST